MKDLHTVADIIESRDMWKHKHKVYVAIKKLGLVPVKWEGQNRKFDNAQRKLIEGELDRIINRRSTTTV